MPRHSSFVVTQPAPVVVTQPAPVVTQPALVVTQPAPVVTAPVVFTQPAPAPVVLAPGIGVHVRGWDFTLSPFGVSVGYYGPFWRPLPPPVVVHPHHKHWWRMYDRHHCRGRW